MPRASLPTYQHWENTCVTQISKYMKYKEVIYIYVCVYIYIEVNYTVGERRWLSYVQYIFKAMFVTFYRPRHNCLFTHKC